MKKSTIIIIGIILAIIIFWSELNDAITLLTNYAKLLATGIWDVPKIFAEVIGNFVSVFGILVILALILRYLQKHKSK
jgi:hypothetical protein